jgi:hypothetical protein
VLGGEVVIKCQTKHTTYTVGTIPECCVLGGEVVIKCKTKNTTYTVETIPISNIKIVERDKIVGFMFNWFVVGCIIVVYCSCYNCYAI